MQIVEDKTVRAVEVKVAEITPDGLLLDVYGFTFDDVKLGERLTPAEVMANGDWMVCSTWDPIRPAEVTLNLRPEIQHLRDLRAALTALRNEESSTTDSERYKLLKSKAGPVRVAEARVQLQAFVVRVMFRSAMGMWPREFDALL